MTARITSRTNPLIRRARALGSDASVRRSEGAFLAEGVKLVEEALLAGAAIERVLHSPRLAVSERGRALLGRIQTGSLAHTATSDAVLDAVANAESSQGIVAVIRTAGAPTLAPSGPDSMWVVAWGLQDPGNLGTLLRTSDAAGADLFVTVAGTADPTSPKAVRASAGSVFRLPILRGAAPDDVLDAAAAHGVRLFGTAPEGGIHHYEPDYRGPVGIVFGREGEGLPPLVTKRLHRSVTIPMQHGVESLNVAAAAAVVLFEAARQRSR